MLRNQTLKLFFILFAFLALPASAADPGDKWTLRLSGLWVDPSVEFEDDESPDLDSETDFGVSLTLERRISRRFGIELGALHADSTFGYEVDLLEDDTFLARYDTDFNLFTAGLNFHLTPDRSTDIYIGPVFAYTDFGDVTIQNVFRDSFILAELRGSDDFGLGAQIGADLPLGDGAWQLSLSARYIDSSLGLTLNNGSETKIDFAPLMLGAGIGFRF